MRLSDVLCSVYFVLNLCTEHYLVSFYTPFTKQNKMNENYDIVLSLTSGPRKVIPSLEGPGERPVEKTLIFVCPGSPVDRV